MCVSITVTPRRSQFRRCIRERREVRSNVFSRFRPYRPTDMGETTRSGVARAVERAIRWGIVAVFGEGFRRRNPGAVVNAAVAFAATFLPDLVERHYEVEFRPWQRVYAGTAMLAHAVGMLGPYDDTWWWDHVTHTLSATLLGGLVHAAAHRRDRDPGPRVVTAVAVAGVVWEAAEYAIHAVSQRLGLEPILIPYSAHDTLLDLVFDLVGAVVVLAFGDRLLGNFTGRGEAERKRRQEESVVRTEKDS
jgi:hypothetical protein